jgi:hypothetical protein
MYPARKFDAQGQPAIEERGPSVRALAVRNWSDPSRMLGDVGRIFAALSEFNVKFMGTGSTHHCAGGMHNADTTILFECDDRTYAKIRRLPAVAGANELNPNTVMRNLDADVMNASSDEIAAVRKQHRANIISRLLLNCTPTSLHQVTRHLTRSGVAITSVKRPERAVERDEIAEYKIYVQNMREKARAAVEQLMCKKNIDGALGNKTTVRLNGNVVDVQKLEQHLFEQFAGRIDRLDIGPVSAVIREQNQPTVRVTDPPGA